MKHYIEKCLAGVDLTVEEASTALDSIISGGATDAQIAGLLIALRAKGESVSELVGFARTMLERSVHVSVEDHDAIDIVGTGGDGAGTFNISTVTAFVVAGAGVTVAKHGNRSVSSKCGSADVLQALGIETGIDPQRVEECINRIGIGFLFAPVFHPAMRNVAKPRAELGVRSIFNMLGPLTNPARVKRHFIGAFNPDAAGKIARTLAELRAVRACVVHNADGMDEVGLAKPTLAINVECGKDLTSEHLRAEDFNLPEVTLSQLAGGDPQENARIILSILEGEKGPRRSVVLANAAIAFGVGGKCSSLKQGVHLASESIDSGSALRALNQLREFTGKR